MQIHELKLHNIKEAQLTEVDAEGPSGVQNIFNIGREVLKNPKSFVSSRALGAAGQAATQRYAAKLAGKVGNIANANIAPLAKQLAAGWPQIAKTLQPPVMAQGSATPNTQQPAAAPATPTPSSAQPTITPATKIQGAKPGQPTAADYANLERKLQAQLAKQQTGQQSSDKPPYAEELWGKPSKYDNLKEDAAGDYRKSFIQYAQRVLGARGIDTDVLRNDEKINRQLNFILEQIVELANQPQQQQAVVEEYFNTALTAYNQMVADPATYQRLNPPGSRPSLQASDIDQEMKQLFNQLNIGSTQLQSLAQKAAEATGSNSVRSTGNPVFDALMRAAGMKITR
jgi:hypothetical protein